MMLGVFLFCELSDVRYVSYCIEILCRGAEDRLCYRAVVSFDFDVHFDCGKFIICSFRFNDAFYRYLTMIGMCVVVISNL